MTDFASKRLEALDLQGRYRTLLEASGKAGTLIELGGNSYINFGSNDYLGLASNESVSEAASKALEHWGFGAGSARLISGSLAPHHEFEKLAAKFTGRESALMFNSGYHANVGVIPVLAREGDVIYSDQLCHASIVDGCRLSKAEKKIFPHSNCEALDKMLSENTSQGLRWVICEGLYSMDGDIAPLAELRAVCDKYRAMLIVDEAHSLGILGESGRGACEHRGVMQVADIYVGTCSKAIGGFGAFVAGKREIVELLINEARSFIFSTALPPVVVAGDMASLEIISAAEGQGLREKLWSNVRKFKDGLRHMGLEADESPSPIVSVVIGSASDAMAAAQHMLERGVFVRAIRYPTVPEGTSRLRFSLRADMNDEQMGRCLEALGALGEK